MKILECHTRGNKEFSPFFSYVSAFGKTRSIENHYHASKVFKSSKGMPLFPQNWKESKKLSKAGFRQIAWKIGDFILPVRSDGKRYQIDDLGVQWYILLWYKHLKQNPWKVEYIQQFDKFNDPFKGKFPFCQANVMLKVQQDGLNGLRLMASELWNLLNHNSLTIEYNLLDIQYGFICHKVNSHGGMTELAQQICERYPIVYDSYQDSFLSGCLEDIRVIPVSNNLAVVNMFTQIDEQTDVTALRQCVLKLADLQETSCPAPIYLPHTIFDGISDNQASQVLSLVKNHLMPVAICS